MIIEKINLPHILILDHIENVKKIEYKDMLGVIDYIEELKEKNYGLISADFPNITYDNNDTTAMCWYINIYKIKCELRFGNQNEEDQDKLHKKIYEELLKISINTSLSSNDDNNPELDNGILDLKLGKGTNKRLYRVTYNLTKTYIEQAIQECQDTIINNEQDKKGFTIH